MTDKTPNKKAAFAAALGDAYLKQTMKFHYDSVPQNDQVLHNYIKDLQTKMYNGMGIPASLFTEQQTNYSSSASFTFEEIMAAKKAFKTAYQPDWRQGKTAYQKGYEQVFGDPFTSTRPAYQGPVVQHDGQKSSYQQKKDEEARQALRNKAKAETTLRFTYHRDRSGVLRLERVAKVQKGLVV